MQQRIPRRGVFSAFAMIVDINGFTQMVKESDGFLVAQFVRDVLSGAVDAIESQNGRVMNFMGDALLAILFDPEKVFLACATVARNVDRHCELISSHQKKFPHDWSYAKGGASLKIAVEYGWMDVSSISSMHFGKHRLIIGPPINYASRISTAEDGNRCLLGPVAVRNRGMDRWRCEGPYTIQGKHKEGPYEYYQLDLSDVWREGPRQTGKETFWG
jgi:class 3 adenylate cyclase